MIKKFSKFKKPKLLILVGIQGPGKSTWIKQNKPKWKKTTVLNPDSIRKELTGDISDHSQEKYVWWILSKEAGYQLSCKKNVIIDGTNCYTAGRLDMIEQIEKEAGCEFDKEARIFKTDPETAKERIKKDLENKVDRSNVPEEVVDNFYDAYLHTLTQLETEGYKIIDKYTE